MATTKKPSVKKTAAKKRAASKPKRKPNPLFAAVKARSEKKKKPIKTLQLVGYLHHGEATADDYVDIYPSLSDLSSYYSVPEDSIVHEEPPTTGDGPTIFYIEDDARVTHVKAATAADHAKLFAGEVSSNFHFERESKGPPINAASTVGKCSTKPHSTGGVSCLVRSIIFGVLEGGWCPPPPPHW